MWAEFVGVVVCLVACWWRLGGVLVAVGWRVGVVLSGVRWRCPVAVSGECRLGSVGRVVFSGAWFGVTVRGGVGGGPV